jgi:hypothetical protein
MMMIIIIIMKKGDKKKILVIVINTSQIISLNINTVIQQRQILSHKSKYNSSFVLFNHVN